MIGVIRIIKAGDDGWSIEDYAKEIEKNLQCVPEAVR